MYFVLAPNGEDLKIDSELVIGRGKYGIDTKKCSRNQIILYIGKDGVLRMRVVSSTFKFFINTFIFTK